LKTVEESKELMEQVQKLKLEAERGDCYRRRVRQSRQPKG
jgi:hypothetical protein